MSSDDELFLENQLCFALYSSTLAMGKIYQPLLKHLGITYPQYLVFLVLWQKDKISITTLGQQLFLDSGTLTPLLKRMESAGLILRERSPGDERQVIVTLTSEGRTLRKKAAEIPKKILCALDISPTEARSTTKLLKSLRLNLLNSDLIKAKKKKAV